MDTRGSLVLATTIRPTFKTTLQQLQTSHVSVSRNRRRVYIQAQGVSGDASASLSSTRTTAVAPAATEVASLPTSMATTVENFSEKQTNAGLSTTTYQVEDFTGTNINRNNTDSESSVNDGAALPPDGPGNDDNSSSGDDGDNDPMPSLSNPLSFLLRGLRGRLAADPFFTQKLLVECGLDAAIIVGVNLAARQERFFPEIEFTFCQLAVSLLSDFALVYLLAPSIYRSAAAPGSFQYKLEFLPSHVFQKSPSAVTPFTKTSRFTTFIMKGVQYSGVGYAMGCLGAASVQGLIWMRERLDPVFLPPPTVQSISGTAFAWSAFMGTSSNVRYNLVHGLEDYLYRKSARAGTLGSVVLRLFNNYAGAAQWVFVTDSIDLDVPWVPARPAKDGKERKARRRPGK
jgi:Protein RETICULATA-related